jgi:hypothetical protein
MQKECRLCEFYSEFIITMKFTTKLPYVFSADKTHNE